MARCDAPGVAPLTYVAPPRVPAISCRWTQAWLSRFPLDTPRGAVEHARSCRDPLGPADVRVWLRNAWNQLVHDVTVASDSPLDFLIAWYSRHSDGDWEHDLGIRIGTLDNPGWSLDVRIGDTELDGIATDWHKDDERDDV